MKHNSSLTERGYILCAFTATALGLLLYTDGYAATMPGNTFTSSTRTITTMTCDEHYLWAGTCGQGLLRIDKNSGEATLFTTANSGLTGGCVRALVSEKDGSLLVGTAEGGIVRFNNSTWERISGLSDNNVRGMTVDEQGNIWAWMQTLGLVRQSNGTWQPVINRFGGALTRNPNDNVWAMNVPLSGSPDCSDGWIQEYVGGGLQSTISLAPVCPELTYPQLLAVDNKKNCWIGVQDQLIKITSHSIDRFPLSNDTAMHKTVTALAANYNERLLIALATYSGTSEVYIFDQINGNGGPLDSCAFTIDSSYITTACADPTINGFWCSAADGKIIKIDMFNHPTVFTIGNSVLPSNSITSLLFDASGNLWVATDNGIARCADTAWTIYPGADDSIPGLEVTSLALDSAGIIWAGFQQPPYSSMINSGISCFSNNHWQVLTRDHISVKSIVVDKSGVQWVVSNGGVYRYQNSQCERLFETIPSSDARIALGTQVNAIAFDDGNTPWIGTGLGIKKYANGAWTDDSVINGLLPKSEGPVVGVMVNTLCITGSTAWIGTARGLLKISGNKGELIDTIGSLLPDLNVQCIASDGPNSAWIGTKRGLVNLAGQDHATYTTGNSPLYDNDITACAIAPNNEVWVGTRLGGLTVLRQTAVAMKRETVSNGIKNSKPVAVSISTLRPQTWRISIHARAAAAIGFSIISLQGKLMKRFAATSDGTGLISFSWNGTDCSNRPVAKGMYLGIVTVNGRIFERTMIPR
jgi:uncharacterized membrane protein